MKNLPINKKFIFYLCLIDNSFLYEITILCNALKYNYIVRKYKQKTFFYISKVHYNKFVENFNEYLREEIQEKENIEVSLNLKTGNFSKVMIIFFIVFYFFTKKNYFFWIKVGANNAYKLINGEFFRSITALFLHNDLIHLFSNLIFFYLFLKYITYFFGEGIGWFLILLSGICGNIISAYIHQNFYISIGFSTAVFGSLGLLSYVGFYFIKDREKLFVRKYLPFVGGIFLLIMLGLDKQTDTIAHICGFFSGYLIGWAYFNRFYYFFNKKNNDIIFKKIVIFIIAFSWFFQLYLNKGG